MCPLVSGGQKQHFFIVVIIFWFKMSQASSKIMDFFSFSFVCIQKTQLQFSLAFRLYRIKYLHTLFLNMTLHSCLTHFSPLDFLHSGQRMSRKESRLFTSSTITLRPQAGRRARQIAERSLLHIPGVLGMELKAPNFQARPHDCRVP